MKILIVCSLNSGELSTYVQDQVHAIGKHDIKIEYFSVKGKGLRGYLANLSLLKKKIGEVGPDLIHAHYGFSGLLASLQRQCPVVITFHGSDINRRKNRPISLLASRLSRFNIYVHPDLPKRILDNRGFPIIPCGVDLEVFFPVEKQKARKVLGLDAKRIYVLFSSSFTNEVKNAPLAEKALLLVKEDIELLELKGFTREKTNYLMNAVDFLLVTSFSETGPLVVKEAMACNCPIVSTDVGDVKGVIDCIDGCYISGYDPTDVADKIQKALIFSKQTIDTEGRARIINLGLDSESTANKIIKIYKEISDK